MKRSAPPWRDPTFYGFILFGVVLLCTGLLCRVKAASTPAPPTETVVQPSGAPPRLPDGLDPSPSIFPPAPSPGPLSF